MHHRFARTGTTKDSADETISKEVRVDLSHATPLPLITATFMIIMGIGFIAANRARFSSPAFKPALALAPPDILGAIILATGLILAVGIFTRRWQLRTAGYAIGAVWCLFFSITFIWAVVNDPRASFTGAITYAFVGAFLLTLARTARQ